MTTSQPLLDGSLHRDVLRILGDSVEVTESDTEIVVRLVVPGPAAGSVDVTLDGGVLTVSGSRSDPETDAVSRSVRVGSDVAFDRVAATSYQGLIEVTLPKSRVTADVQR